jgi:sigma-E factor negative regulatory protein RseA
MNEELDSQLSAMFDDELPEDQCQLLARRLSRDDALKARWRRYAVIGASVRAGRADGQPGVRLETNLASRVAAVISVEPALTGVVAGETRKAAGMRWWHPVVGGAIAAGVAAMSVLWIRADAPVGAGPMVADNAAASALSTDVVGDPDAPDSYVVPASVDRNPNVPTAELANYVVAHSEYSAPAFRRNLISALIASNEGTAGVVDESDDANVVESPAKNVEEAK